MDRFINTIKPVFEGIVNRTDSMKLGVVRSHDRALIAYELFATDTEVTERLFMKQTHFLSINWRAHALPPILSGETSEHIWLTSRECVHCLSSAKNIGLTSNFNITLQIDLKIQFRC
jgi:hypothetical protein